MPVAGDPTYRELEQQVVLLRAGLERLVRAIGAEHDGDHRPRAHSMAVMCAVRHAQNLLAVPQSPTVVVDETLASLDEMLLRPDDEVRP